MKYTTLAGSLLLSASTMAAASTQLTIATVNNPQMQVMQKLTPYFEKKYPNIKVDWDVMPENELRQKVTVDISTQAGSYDMVTLGPLETPIWAKNGWLKPFDNLPASYDESDLIKPIRKILSYNGQLYALPFYGSSSFTYYRTDLFKKAGINMPLHPTWKQIEAFAEKLNDPENGVHGICLRGMPGWGENMALFDTMVNTYGGRWFDMKWQPELTSDAWHKALSMYVKLITSYGPPGSTSDGFVEDENLFANGNCAIWVDDTVAAGYVSDPKTSKVAGNVGFAWAPVAKTKNGSHWLWSWGLAIPKDSSNKDAARKFAQWATSMQYIRLVGKKEGWVNAPPGTRYSTYKNPHYQKAAGAYAKLTRASIDQATPNKPTDKPVPYTGVQYVAIPEFEGIGASVAQNVAATLAGKMSQKDALKKSQRYVEGVMKQAGYDKR